MELFLQGLVLLVAGMGIVYLFLALLVWVMNHSARIVQRFNHILPDEAPRKRKAAHHKEPIAQAGADEVKIAIAIASAAAKTR